MLFGVVPGLGAHVENGAMVGSEWILWESKETGIHHWPHGIGSIVERGQHFPSQGTHSSFQGSAAVWVARARSGGQGQKDSKTQSNYLNSSLKSLVTERLKWGPPSWQKASYVFSLQWELMSRFKKTVCRLSRTMQNNNGGAQVLGFKSLEFNLVYLGKKKRGKT